MLHFYRKALIAVFVLLLISAALAGWALKATFLTANLLPKARAEILWTPEPEIDENWGGKSTLTLNDDQYSLDYRFLLDDKVNYPNAALALAFIDGNNEALHVDLSMYEQLSFSVKCEPSNVLSLAVFTFDKRVTKTDDLSSYRFPTSYFTCNQNWSEVEINLRHLETPQWWYEQYKLELSEQDYELTEVPKITFGISSQTPRGLASKVNIDEIVISGRDWSKLHGAVAIIVVLWIGFLFWFFRAHTRALIGELKQKLQHDRPLVAYQALSLEPKADKDKTSVLRFMATAYADPELNLEIAVSKLGISRTKINEVLKAELGYTFSTYLNRLRLSEAARLLSEKDDANVAEIAYSVGYKNVSYFNKLFKSEYACTPKTFKDIYNK